MAGWRQRKLCNPVAWRKRYLCISKNLQTWKKNIFIGTNVHVMSTIMNITMSTTATTTTMTTTMNTMTTTTATNTTITTGKWSTAA